MGSETYKIIWYLNRVCNFNCEYCLDTFGRTNFKKNNKIIPIPFIKNACKNLLSMGKKKYAFTLFGGETTLYRELPLFIDTLYENLDNKVSNMMFTSNASKPINYFKNFLHYDDTFIIRLSAHMEHWDPHYFDVIDFLCENNIRVFTEVMFNLNYKDLVFKVADEVIKRKLKYPKLNGRIKPVFIDVPFKDYFYNYSKQDLNDFYKKNNEFGYTSYKYDIDLKKLNKYCILGSERCILNSDGVYSDFCVVANRKANHGKSIFLLDSFNFKKDYLQITKCETNKKCLHAPSEQFDNREDAQKELEKILYENN